MRYQTSISRCNPGLLVSVRDHREAMIAQQLGASIVDVKEPDNGPLGMPSVKTMNLVLANLPLDSCISVALGELHEAVKFPGKIAEMFTGLTDSHRIGFAKIGLAEMQDRPNWRQSLADAISEIPQTTTSVAAIYADQSLASSPDAAEVVETATRLGCGAVLIDTFSKTGGNVFDHLTPVELKRIVDSVKRHEMCSVLAGSVRLESLMTACEIAPDFIGVRGAVCACGDRARSLCAQAMRGFQNNLDQITSIRNLN